MEAEASRPPPPLKVAGRRTVGFNSDVSPSSVLRDGESPSSARAEVHSPSGALSAALRREKSVPALTLTLPKLKLGQKGKGIPRSKSQGNLRAATPAVEAPPAPKSATSSPHAASSSGSEPQSRPFNIPRRRRTVSVDFEQPGPHPGDADDAATTPVISAASSLLDRHLGGALTAAGSGALPPPPGSAADSPGGGGGGNGGLQLQRQPSAASSAKELYVAQADAVTAHAQVLSLQTALKKEQEEVLRLREQLERMTAERDRLLTELQHGGDASSLFVLDRMSLDASRRASGGGPPGGGRGYQLPPPPPAGGTAAGRLAAGGGGNGNGGAPGLPPLPNGGPPRPRSALKAMFRLP